MTDKKFPSPDEIQREFEEFVRGRFGGQVQVFSQPAGEPPPPPPATAGSAEPADEPEADKWFDAKRFDYKPKDIKEYLDRFVIRQDEAKKALAIAVCDHYNNVKRTLERPDDVGDTYAKQNVLVTGPTGVGKTYLVKQIAKLIGVPFVKADATRFSETGYVGANVDDLIRDLVAQADGDVELAQYGIVYIDEADKLASPSSGQSRDVSGRGVQFGLLKLMEETEVDLSSGNDMRSQLQAFMEFQSKGKVSKKLVNTRHILFIVSGAFTGLDQIISKRLNEGAIGFDVTPKDETPSKERRSSDNFHEYAETQDFVDYGFEPEFIGRLPIRVACQHLNKDDLFDILNSSEGSIIKQYVQSFRSFGIDVEFTEGALKAIAGKAENVKTGARALMTVCEQVLRNYKYELPSSPVDHLVIDERVIEEPVQHLQQILANPGHTAEYRERKQVRRFEGMFSDRHGMKMSFTDAAVALICERARERNISVLDYCDSLLYSYEYGLKLIQQNTGRTEYLLDVDVVENPQGALERLIRESYSKAEPSGEMD